MTDKPTYNAEEAARFLGITRRDIMRLCRKKLLKHIHMNPSHKDVRVAKDELLRFREGSE
jgi:hypothetical protein